MTRLKKIGVALVLVVAVLALGIVAALGANDMFTGSMYRLSIYVKDMGDIVKKVEADDLKAIDELDKILIEIDTYLFNTPVNPETEGYEDADKKIKDAKILLVEKSLEQVAANEDPLEKSKYLKLAGEWFENIPFTDEELAGDFYVNTLDLIASTVVDVAESLYNDIDPTMLESSVEKDIATEGVKIKRLRTFITANKVSQDSEHYVRYVEVYNDYLDIWNEYQAGMTARYEALTYGAPLSEYGLGKGVNTYNFEHGQKAPGLSNVSKANSAGITRSVQSVTETETYVNADGSTTTNSYRTIRWPSEADVAINAYITPSYTGTSSGAVIEFDITTFGSWLDNSINFGDRRSDTEVAALGGDTTAMHLTIDKNGNLLVTLPGATAKSIQFENVITPGQWTRISMVIDPKYPDEAKLFVDYCYICTFDSLLHGSNPTNMRIGNTSVKSGEFSFDNFSVQLGTWFRNDNLINDIVDPLDKLEFFTEYMVEETNRIPDRMVAYSSIKDIINQFAGYNGDTGLYEVLPAYVGNERVEACVEKLNGFDSVAIINEYKRMNLDQLSALTDDLKEIDRNLSTITSRQTKLDSINKFINNNAAYIEEGATYNDILAYIGEVQLGIDMDKTITSFVSAMTAFSSSPSVHILEMKYNTALGLIDTLDLSLLDKEGYETFKTSYEVFLSAPEKITNQIFERNSRDIVTYMNYLVENFPNEMDWKLTFIEGDNLTEAQIKNNETFAFLAEYVAKVRKLVNEGYSLKYNGIDGAIQRFEMMNGHFYDYLQGQHATEIAAKLDEFAASDSYIVKQGIIAFLERYKAENDVDVTHAMIAPLETRFNAYKAELEFQADSYTEILRQNTVYFVNYVRLFDTAITYTEKLALYENATVYYYLMNSSGDGVEEAIVIYDAMTAELALTENASKTFINCLDLMQLTENVDIRYSYLVEAMSNYALIDTSIEGVAEALVRYESELAAYRAEINEANGEICEIGESLGSLRANCGLSAIISVIIEKLFNFAK